MNEPRYTHLVRSYDGAGKPTTTLHLSLKEAIAEQKEREDEGLFPVTVMPVQTEHISLTKQGEVVTVYKEPAGTRKHLAHRQVAR